MDARRSSGTARASGSRRNRFGEREGAITLVHGSPRDPTWEYITSAPVARANLALLETP